MKQIRILLALLLATVLLAVSARAEAGFTEREPVAIYTSEWLPYINGRGAPLSNDAVLVSLVALEAGYDLEWRYFPFNAAYDLVKRNKAMLAFPYFKTEERASEVLFSRPILEVVSQLYFNRQYHKAEEFGKDLRRYRIGKVAGYSYGDRLDKLLSAAVAFPSERDAIAGLLNNQIDILPITEEVADATLERYFPNRRQLIQEIPLAEPYKASPLFLIAPKSAEGEKLINAFNQAISDLTDRGVISITSRELKRYRQPDFAELITAEGYPVILGQTKKDEETTRYFTLPNGTQVLVLQWSQRIQEASHTDRLYMNMVDLSRVLILNGPHVGRELYVKNMHIHLR
ncbi:MAG: transporter substrate-binding domain-containing protein [Ketobacteraceae bacterium]|nr:transporter substrate-binding domain-containing protein [Ketobacteraceae bacterium]